MVASAVSSTRAATPEPNTAEPWAAGQATPATTRPMISAKADIKTQSNTKTSLGTKAPAKSRKPTMAMSEPATKLPSPAKARAKPKAKAKIKIKVNNNIEIAM